MAFWGCASFENDYASDWIYELDKAGPVEAVGEALTAVDGEDELVSAPLCAAAVAAAEVVAAMAGRPPADPPQEVSAAAERFGAPPAELIGLANQVVGRIFEDSALRSRWYDTDDFEAWEDAIGDLLDRLEPPGGRPMI